MKILNDGYTLIKLRRHDAQMADVLSEATKFIGACYGSRVDGDMSTIRYEVWASKMAKPNISSAPKAANIATDK